MAPAVGRGVQQGAGERWRQGLPRAKRLVDHREAQTLARLGGEGLGQAQAPLPGGPTAPAQAMAQDWRWGLVGRRGQGGGDVDDDGGPRLGGCGQGAGLGMGEHGGGVRLAQGGGLGQAFDRAGMLAGHAVHIAQLHQDGRGMWAALQIGGVEVCRFGPMAGIAHAVGLLQQPPRWVEHGKAGQAKAGWGAGWAGYRGWWCLCQQRCSGDRRCLGFGDGHGEQGDAERAHIATMRLARPVEPQVQAQHGAVIQSAGDADFEGAMLWHGMARGRAILDQQRHGIIYRPAGRVELQRHHHGAAGRGVGFDQQLREAAAHPGAAGLRGVPAACQRYRLG